MSLAIDSKIYRLRGLSPASWLAAVVCFVALVGGGWRCTPREKKGLSGAARGRNVLFVSVDTLRGDRVGYSGYFRETSPQIDRMAAGGVAFAAAYAQRAETWPSLSSIMTSLYPTQHGAVANGYRTLGEKTTIAEVLQGAGYDTAAFLANMCRANHRGWKLKNCGNDKEVTDRAVWWLGEKREAPFFLWVHLMGPHRPYLIPREQAEQLDPGYTGPIDGMAKSLDRIMIEGTPLNERDIFHLNALYDGVVQNTDRRVGRILARLAELGLEKDTLVVFFSDHGEELYEHNRYFFHSCSVYDSTLHIPLAFSAPGVLPARELGMQVESIDIAPTVLDLLGIAAPGQFQGLSLLPYIEREQPPERDKPAFSEFGYTNVRTVRAGGWKLVDNPAAHTPQCFEGAPADLYPIAVAELYDVRKDPREQNNLAAAEPRRVGEMRKLLRQRFGRGGTAVRQQVDPGMAEELRSLGYVNP